MCAGRLFKSLLYIIPDGPVRRHGDDTNLLVSNLSAGVQTNNTTGKPTGQQITNKTYPDHSRHQNKYLLFHIHSLHHHKTFTFTQIPSWKSSRLQT
jgi:hypothetical protein